jgi:membrane dipeptidase
MDMLFADLHCDTLTSYDSLRSGGGQVSLPALHSAGCRLMCFAAFLRYDLGDLLSKALSYAHSLDSQIAASADLARLVRCRADLDDALSTDRVGAMFTVEEGAVVEGDVANLHRLYEAGMRMMTLCWNHVNGIATPAVSMAAVADKGEMALYDVNSTPLTEFGRRLVAEMNDLGILVDVSHLNDGGFWEVLRISRAPIVASHSNARAVRGVARNLSDEMIAALARSGGVMGLNLCPDFLCDNVEDVLDYAVRHVVHIWQVGGENVLALGSDFDGTVTRAPLTDCTKIPLLYGALCDQMPPRVVDKMMWGNFYRVFGEVCG